ncbi:MAG: YbhB/YbcL family Raf kinase inhibitor-like protein [Silvibacterium sp.]|nr:YbhB/YbcL family Raf kinase inhibitor-like protein [Silvibacterium sp.]
MPLLPIPLQKPSALLILVATLSLGTICACKRRADGDPAEEQARSSIALTSASFANGSRIPQKYTCDGAGLSPDIQLPTAPSGTKSFLLVMDDPDASGFVHWLLYNIPADTHDIPEGPSSRGVLPTGSAEGENSLGRTGYFGPCPPPPGTHHYVFRLYALDTTVNLPAGQRKKDLAAAAKGHILAEGTLTGLYSRGGG